MIVFVISTLPLVTKMVVNGLGWQESGLPGQVDEGMRSAGAGVVVTSGRARIIELKVAISERGCGERKRDFTGGLKVRERMF